MESCGGGGWGIGNGGFCGCVNMENCVPLTLEIH